MLLVAMSPSLSAEQINSNNGAILVITQEDGGLVVKNIGDEPAHNVVWSVEVTASIVFFGLPKAGVVTVLDPGQSSPIKTGFVFGLGAATETRTASADNAETFIDKDEFILLGFFRIGL